jgi:hypothetical protein
MTRTAAIGAGIAAVAAAVVLAIVWLASSPGPNANEPTKALTVLTSINPRPAFFGDRVVARAEILVDDRRIDPDSVRLDESFQPFALAGAPTRSRSHAGHVTSLGYRFALECLTDACLPKGATREVAPAPLQVHAGASSTTARWPAAQIVARVPGSAVSKSPTPWHVQLALPPVGYRNDPIALANILTVLAAVLAGLAVGLAAWEIARHRKQMLLRARARTRLERALDLARESVTRDVDDRRKALALLARELNGDRELTFAAEKLAWARADPSPPNVEALVSEIEEATRR